MADYVVAKIVVRGEPSALELLREGHLSNDALDFNSVLPIPGELLLDESSAWETGYDAMFGDWTIPAQAWTWKDAARRLGFPFPLASREQVVACINSYEHPGFYFDGAVQYKRNIESYGFFSWYGWCEKHWGTKSNAEDVLVKVLGDSIEIRFATAGAFPEPVFVALSKTFPTLAFEVLTVDEATEKPLCFVMQNGVSVPSRTVSKRQARKELDA